MDLGIAGKVAFFTGGSKGMGRIAARMLADEGCRVAIVARSKGPVDEAVSEITANGGTAIGVTADISQQEQVTAAVERVTRELGAPQIVIGQTLFTKPGDFDDITDPEVYVDSFRAYTMSTVYLLKAVLPAMKAAGWGRFVHVGSATAKEPEGAIHHVVANGTRPSTIGLLKTVADEYAQYGVTVNTVAPGWIETQNAIAYLDRQAGLTSPEERRRWMKDHARVPAARMGRPEEIASMIVYLCSELAGYVNGAWIEVDGAHHRSAF
jgi:3-oxoacyl-[acyl-carrier protein] reductase